MSLNVFEMILLVVAGADRTPPIAKARIHNEETIAVVSVCLKNESGKIVLENS